MTALGARAGPDDGRLKYRAYHPFLFSTDEDVRALTRGKQLEMRDESRILHLAKDTFDRTRRWVSETNRKEAQAEFLDFTNLKFAARERINFMPRDRLALEVERHEDMYNPDPIAATGMSGKLPGGIVFHAFTDLTECIANFDVKPFLEAFVRRLSASMPDYVWQFGDHHYYRTVGYLFKDGRWEPRRFPVQKQVVMALGPLPPVAPAECVVCGKTDERVSPTLEPKRAHAHNACLDAAGPLVEEDAAHDDEKPSEPTE